LKSFQRPRTQHDKAFIIFTSLVEEANGRFNEKLLTYKAEASSTASRAVQAQIRGEISKALQILMCFCMNSVFIETSIESLLDVWINNRKILQKLQNVTRLPQCFLIQ
jgi:hypothetical protein